MAPGMLPTIGWYGRGLCVDVSTGHAADEPLDAGVARAYLGGRGLGAWLLLSRGVYDIEPQSGQPAHLRAGPAYGHRRPRRRTLQRELAFAADAYRPRRQLGGAFGIVFKRMGYDYLWVDGRCADPAYLLISGTNGDVHIKSCGRPLACGGSRYPTRLRVCASCTPAVRPQ